MSLTQKLEQVGKKLRSLPSIRKISSKKNGLITVRSLWGITHVMVGGFYESGPYMTRVVAKMLKKIPREFAPKSILMLGLGGGSGIEVLRRRFPRSKMTVVEHDPEMIQLAHQLVFSKINYTPEIIEGDAGDVVKTLCENGRSFDIVIFDLFTGGNPSPLLNSEVFLQNIQRCLTSHGFLSVNFYRTRLQLGPMVEKYFSKFALSQSEYNFMATYRQFGQGTVGDPIPEGFTTKQQSEIYLQAGTRTLKSTIVGQKNSRGLRYSWGPLALEVYACGNQPQLDKWRGLRLVMWSPTRPVAKNMWWWENPLASAGWQIGICKSSLKYWGRWSDHARRHLKKWQNQSRFVIHLASVDEFETAYNASRKLDSTLRWAFMREVKSYLPDNSDKLSIWLIRDTQTNHEVAGLVTVDLTDVDQTVHLVSFIGKEAQRLSVGYGLISQWCEQTNERGINWMNFGILWQPKDPVAWKGYSKFKRQFGLYIIRYPKPRARLTFGV